MMNTVTTNTSATSLPSLETLRRLSALRADVRHFFNRRGYLEVETPILRTTAAMEPHLVSFETRWAPPGKPSRTLYMHTSPEYAMKRLLGAHRSSLFQLARVFRNGEESDSHHREFTLVEWYRVDGDYTGLMDEMEELVRMLARAHAVDSAHRISPFSQEAEPVDLSRPFERLTVRDAFIEYAGLDPWAHADASSLASAARRRGVDTGDEWSWADVFHAVLLERVEPQLGTQGRATFLLDYPPRLAALARTRGEPDGTRVAERVELYMGGLELSNGFSELTDPAEQRARFEAEQEARRALGHPVHEIDEDLLAALEHCPTCAGNALGLDRLAMLLLGKTSIRDVIMVAGRNRGAGARTPSSDASR